MEIIGAKNHKKAGVRTYMAKEPNTAKAETARTVSHIARDPPRNGRGPRQDERRRRGRADRKGDAHQRGSPRNSAQVAALLQGEQLVAPPPLPPLVFTTAEVEQVRPMLAEASRNWDLLHPEFQRRLLLAFRLMRERHGYDMALLEGYRSPERQDRLAALGNGVTNARAFQSYHQFGLAADCAFLRDGKLVISERDPWAMRGYRLYGEVAESLGLTWGGRWKLMDFGHAELRLRGAAQR